MNLYTLPAKIFPHDLIVRPQPRRIVLIRPCCIGDVVLATPTLKALRGAYPEAHITWAVGGWSGKVIDGHDLLDATLDTGASDLPVRRWGDFWRFVRQLRDGKFDMAVSLVRSPLMSLAVYLSRIPVRVGLDSNGRGFGYNLRTPVDPNQPRHEAEIYLDVARKLGIATEGCYVNLPLSKRDIAHVQALLNKKKITAPYIVVHPAGGKNPGMVMDNKRYPPAQFADLATRLAETLNAQIVLIGGPDDGEIIDAVQAKLTIDSSAFIGELSFGEIGALAKSALLYIGNDTGMTHLASAVGAKTVMILGPTDPTRYAPFTSESLAVWRPTSVSQAGVADDNTSDWDWSRDGISVDDAYAQIMTFINSPR